MTYLDVTIIDSLAAEVHEIAISKGWWTEPRNDGELLMLMVSELGEACEGLRQGNPPSDHIPEFSAAEEELADTLVRVLDMCAARGWRIGDALRAKIEFNRNRPMRHGGKKF